MLFYNKDWNNEWVLRIGFNEKAIKSEFKMQQQFWLTIRWYDCEWGTTPPASPPDENPLCKPLWPRAPIPPYQPPCICACAGCNDPDRWLCWPISNRNEIKISFSCNFEVIMTLFALSFLNRKFRFEIVKLWTSCKFKL